MKTGIIVAMDKELRLLTPLMTGSATQDINGFRFYTGTIDGAEVVATKCGIGKVNAAIGAMTMIDNFRPELIVNTGVAGGTGGRAGVLDVVVGTRVAYHDVWCGPGTEWGDAAGCPRFFQTDPRVSALECLRESATVKHGLVCSGDVFVSDPGILARIRSLYPDVDAVDMESAAIAQVCWLRGVAFACIRVISDTPGADDNIAQYENFWEDAPAQTFGLLRGILSELNSSHTSFN